MTKEIKKAMKAEIRKNMVNPFQLNEILYDSWGYDQTNINFFQIVEVKAKSVVIREIAAAASAKERNGYSDMSRFVVPVKDSFKGEPMKKNVQFYIGGNGEPVFYIKSEHRGSITKYDKGEVGLYESWYA